MRLKRHKGLIGRCFGRFSGFGALRAADGDGLSEKGAKGPFSSGGMPIIGALIHDFDGQSVTYR